MRRWQNFPHVVLTRMHAPFIFAPMRRLTAAITTNLRPPVTGYFSPASFQTPSVEFIVATPELDNIVAFSAPRAGLVVPLNISDRPSTTPIILSPTQMNFAPPTLDTFEHYSSPRGGHDFHPNLYSFIDDNELTPLPTEGGGVATGEGNPVPQATDTTKMNFTQLQALLLELFHDMENNGFVDAAKSWIWKLIKGPKGICNNGSKSRKASLRQTIQIMEYWKSYRKPNPQQGGGGPNAAVYSPTRQNYRNVQKVLQYFKDPEPSHGQDMGQVTASYDTIMMRRNNFLAFESHTSVSRAWNLFSKRVYILDPELLAYVTPEVIEDYKDRYPNDWSLNLRVQIQSWISVMGEAWVSDQIDRDGEFFQEALSELYKDAPTAAQRLDATYGSADAPAVLEIGEIRRVIPSTGSREAFRDRILGDATLGESTRFMGNEFFEHLVNVDADIDHVRSFADFCISTENPVVTELKSLYPNLKHSCAVFCILAAYRESWRKYKTVYPKTKGPTELTFAYIVELCKGESWDGVSEVQLTPAECYQFFKEFKLGLTFTSNECEVLDEYHPPVPEGKLRGTTYMSKWVGYHAQLGPKVLKLAYFHNHVEPIQLIEEFNAPNSYVRKKKLLASVTSVPPSKYVKLIAKGSCWSGNEGIATGPDGLLRTMFMKAKELNGVDPNEKSKLQGYADQTFTIYYNRDASNGEEYDKQYDKTLARSNHGNKKHTEYDCILNLLFNHLHASGWAPSVKLASKGTVTCIYLRNFILPNGTKFHFNVCLPCEIPMFADIIAANMGEIEQFQRCKESLASLMANKHTNSHGSEGGMRLLDFPPPILCGHTLDPGETVTGKYWVIDFSKCYTTCMKECPYLPYLSPFQHPTEFDGCHKPEYLYLVNIVQKDDVYKNDVQIIFGFQLIELLDEWAHEIKPRVLCQLKLKTMPIKDVNDLLTRLYDQEDDEYKNMNPEYKKALVNWMIGRLGMKHNTKCFTAGPYCDKRDALLYHEMNGGTLVTIYKPRLFDFDNYDSLNGNEGYYEPPPREVGCYLVHNEIKSDIEDGHQIIRLMVVCQSQLKLYQLNRRLEHHGMRRYGHKTDNAMFALPTHMSDVPAEFTALKGDVPGCLHIDPKDTEAHAHRFPLKKPLTNLRHMGKFRERIMEELGVPYASLPEWDRQEKEYYELDRACVGFEVHEMYSKLKVGPANNGESLEEFTYSIPCRTTLNA